MRGGRPILDKECSFDSEEGKIDTLFHFPVIKVFI